MADNRIIHLAIDYDYTDEDVAQIIGLIMEAKNDPTGAGVVVTRNDVRISVIDLPEKIGEVLVSDISYGPSSMVDLGDIEDDEEGFEDECPGCEDSECPDCNMGDASDESGEPIE